MSKTKSKSKKRKASVPVRREPNGDEVTEEFIRVTVWGVQLKIPTRDMNDFDFVEALTRLQDGEQNPVYLVRVIDTVTGHDPEVLERVKRVVRKRHGSLQGHHMGKFVEAVFSRIQQISPKS